MEDLSKKVDEVLEPTPDFAKLKKELLLKLQQEPTEEAVEAYSSRFHIDLDAAKARLQDNYKKEIEEVNHKEIALRLSNAFKVMSPKLMGMEFRERDREALAKEAVSLSRSAYAKVDEAIIAARLGAKDEIIQTIKMLDLGRLANSFIELEKQNNILLDRIENLEKREPVSLEKRDKPVSLYKRVVGWIIK